MSFDEWFYKQLGDRDETQQPFKIAKMWASCAWYARQQEVDKLQTEIDELQNRIDEAEKWIELNRKTIALEYSGYTTEEYVDADEVMNILKGENQCLDF